MSKRIQDLYNKYNRCKIEEENNEKILKDVISTVSAIKESLDKDTVDVINQYDPNLLDMLNVEKFRDLSNVEEFKKTLEYIINTMYINMESDLG